MRKGGLDKRSSPHVGRCSAAGVEAHELRARTHIQNYLIIQVIQPFVTLVISLPVLDSRISFIRRLYAQLSKKG